MTPPRRAARRAHLHAAWLVAALTLGASPAFAQRTGPSPAGRGEPRLEISVLGLRSAGTTLGDAQASLLGNAVPTGGPVALFATRTQLAAAWRGDLRLGVRLGGGWRVEGGVGYARPTLQVHLSGDVEGVPDVTATSTLTEVVAEGVLVHRWRTGRVAPFVLAGAGYLRQLDEPRTSVGTGQVYVGGGGVIVGLGRGSGGVASRLGLRADVRLEGYRGGLPLVEARRVGLVAGAGLTVALW